MKHSLLKRLERLEVRTEDRGGFLLVPESYPSIDEWAKHWQHYEAGQSEPNTRHSVSGFSFELGQISRRRGRVLNYQAKRAS